MTGEHRAINLHPKWGERRMTCPEYQRLLQLYEVALRRWEQVLWSSRAEVPGIPERLASEMKQKAYVEKNNAHERMRTHKRGLLRVQVEAASGPSSMTGEP